MTTTKRYTNDPDRDALDAILATPEGQETARRLLAEHECHMRGHSWDVVEAWGHEFPVSVICRRGCGAYAPMGAAPKLLRTLIAVESEAQEFPEGFLVPSETMAEVRRVVDPTGVHIDV